ncbi:MAG TPA: S24 family peptidase [Vicinamibacterales bacterium]
MSIRSEEVARAIRASGKSAKAIADALDVSEATISRIRQGNEDNPKVQVLIGIARETGTDVRVFFDSTLEISPQDRHELEQFERWIQEKLRTKDALAEPNAEILSTAREKRVADRRERNRLNADLNLQAIGDSLVGDGILPGDTLFAARYDVSSALPVGKLIACRIGEHVFVKRLMVDKKRRYLISSHPRYRAIELDGLPFEVLGVITGRTGPVK